MTPISFNLTYAATGTAQTATVYVPENGWGKVVVVDATTLPGGTTIAIAIKDRDGYDVFGSGNCAGGSITYFGRIGSVSVGSIPLDRQYTVVGTLSQAWGTAGGTVAVKVYAECNKGSN